MLLPQLERRERHPELMDQPGLDPVLHAQALRGLARVNWLSGTANIIWNTIRPIISASPENPVRVLDVACGDGAVAIELARRAALAQLPVTVCGYDISPTAIDLARKRATTAGVPVDFIVADAVHHPPRDRFDIVVCSLFLHHLADNDAISLLNCMRELAGRMVVVNDLIRSRWGYIMTWCGIRLLSRSHVCHIDGPLSVRAAFTPTEILALAEQAGLTNSEVSRIWPERFLLTWKRT